MFRVRLHAVVLAVAWLTSIGAGELWLFRYHFETGSSGIVPTDWPEGSFVRPAAGKFTLLLFAHPRCPCTRASLEELSRVVARSQGKADVYVLFVHPSGAKDGWERTNNFNRTAAIPGVWPLVDEGGKEARRFGAETSGFTLLFDPNGWLVFKGGITASRGHEGNNIGSSILLTRLSGTASHLENSAVFGCPLFDKSSDSKVEEPRCTP
jgi:hypothetical protein